MKIIITAILTFGISSSWCKVSKQTLEAAFSNTGEIEKRFYKTTPSIKGKYVFGNKDLGFFSIDSIHGKVPIMSYQGDIQIYHQTPESCKRLKDNEFPKSDLVRWLEKEISISQKGDIGNNPFFHFDTKIGIKKKKLFDLSVVFNKRGEIIKAWDEDVKSLATPRAAYYWKEDTIKSHDLKVKVKKRDQSWFTHEYLLYNDIFYTVENYKLFVRPHWNFLTPIESIKDGFKKLKFLLGPSIPVRFNSIVGFDLRTGSEVYRWDSTDTFPIYGDYKYGLKKFIYAHILDPKKFPKKGFDFLHINSIGVGKDNLVISINEIDKLVLLDPKKAKVAKVHDLGSLGIHNQHHIREIAPKKWSLFNNNFHIFPYLPESPNGPSEAVIIEEDNGELKRTHTFKDNILSKHQGGFFKTDKNYFIHYSSIEPENDDLVKVLDSDFKRVGEIKISHQIKNDSSAYRVTPHQELIDFDYNVQKVGLDFRCKN